MNRFICFSDLHLNLWTYGSKVTKDGRNSRLVQQQDVLNQMLNYANEHSIQDIFFCGDFFHKTLVPAEVLQVAYESLSKFSSKDLYFIVGNHDQADRRGKIHMLDFFKKFGMVASEPEICIIKGQPVCLLPYTDSEDTLLKYLKDTEINPGCLVFMHQGVSDIEVNSKGFTLNEILKPSMIGSHILHAFTGHYHTHTMVNPKLTIPGAMTQLNWGDRKEVRGWLDVKVDSGGVSMKHIESVSPRFVQLDFCSTAGVDPDTIFDLQIPGNFIKISNCTDPIGTKESLLEHGAESVEIVPMNDTYDRHGTIIDFSSFGNLIDEYIKTRELDEETVKIGHQLMDDSYAPPEL